MWAHLVKMFGIFSNNYKITCTWTCQVVLSACSDYFQALFAANPCQVSQAKPKPLTPPNRPTPQHPIVILKDVAFEDLQTVVKFMYHGIVNVSSDKLPAVLKVILKKGAALSEYFPTDCGCSADKRPGKEQRADGSLSSWQVKYFLKNVENFLRKQSPSSSPRGLLSVPGQVRQPSTESLPEYLHQSASAMQVPQRSRELFVTKALQRSRSDGGSFPHRAHSAESRGLSFDSPLELSRPKRVLSPPGSNANHAAVRNNVATPLESGSYARKKFRQRSENTMSLSIEQASETDLKEAEREDGKSSYPGPSPSFPREETEHIAKKKRAMFQVKSPPPITTSGPQGRLKLWIEEL